MAMIPINPSNLSPMEYYASLDPVTVTSRTIEAFCGTFATQIKVAAIVGLFLTLVALFYFGRFRPVIVLALSVRMREAIDKALLISIALCFAVVIARAFFGG